MLSTTIVGCLMGAALGFTLSKALHPSSIRALISACVAAAMLVAATPHRKVAQVPTVCTECYLDTDFNAFRA